MAEHVLAAVRTGPSKTELREVPMPDIPDDGALLRMEVAAISGTDTKMYAQPVIREPVIMGGDVGGGVTHISLLPWQE
jgi:threonine dehydrogenase-like Zn-dependent dehydrogenase